MYQKFMVREYLQKHGSITSMEAYEKLKITRLSGRIFELREMGYAITKDMIQSKAATGRRTRYGRYYLVKGAE